MRVNKFKAVGMFVWFSVLHILQKIGGWVVYPFVYWMLMRGWSKRDGNVGQWFLWLFMDDEQTADNKPMQPQWYRDKTPGLSEFDYAYGWQRRNAMYNINYAYKSNHSEIVFHEKDFGNYYWNHKLRTNKGDTGDQLVWYKTAKGQNRFLYSNAGKKWNCYFGWNASPKGRFTIAFKKVS